MALRLVLHDGRMALVVRESNPKKPDENTLDLVYLLDTPLKLEATYRPQRGTWDIEIPAQRALGVPASATTAVQS